MGLLDKLGNFLSSKRRDMNLLVVGLDNSGKTSIINFLKTSDSKVNSVTPTVGFSVETFTTKSLNFTAFDMSGQSRYRNLWEHYYREADAIVFVIDSSDKMRLVVCKEEFESMMNHPELRNKNIPVLILANKIDIRGAFTANDIRSQLELDRLRNKKWHVFGSNALNGEGVGEAFDWLAQELKSIANLS